MKDKAQFFNSILFASSEPPLEALEKICDAWRDISEADWSWLWLFNEYRQHFELFAISPNTAARPPHFITPGVESASYFTLKIKRTIEHIPDVGTWAPPNGKKYEGPQARVVYAELLSQLGSTRYDSVPLIDYSGRELGVLTLHYKEGQESIERMQSISLMTQFSSRAILHAFQTENLRTLVQLNRNTSDALGRPYRPKHARERYVTDLLELIHDRTNSDAVSIFFQSPMDGGVYECIGSNGLKDVSTGQYLNPAELTRAKYRLGEGRTGQCIEANKVMFVDGVDSSTKYIDRDRYQRDVLVGPTLLFPIPSPSGTPPAAGVIRCSQHRPIHFAQELRSFDAMEIEALRFIAEQATVVLGVCRTRIRREQITASAKHDIGTQLSIISNEIEELECCTELHGDAGRKAMGNLQTACLLARSVASQLATGEGEPPRDDPAYGSGQVSLGDMLRRLVGILEHMAAHFRIKVVHSVRAEVLVRVDRLLLERALTNLIVNAIQNAVDGSTVNVELSTDAPHEILISVSNEGTIDPNARERLFEFGMGSWRKRGGPGSGLGLWAAREAIRQLGGDVELASSEEEHNVRFHVRLPASS